MVIFEYLLQVTDLLRMVCLTEDLAYLTKFLEEILGLYIDSIPKTLGNLYDSLGFMIPQKLAGVLPLDFFSDDSVTEENISPLLSVPLLSSAHRSVSGGTESDQLEELRTRSAKKRRKNALIRHKSIAEVSQNLRQIEIPKVSKRATKNESSRPPLQQPLLPVKDPVQEVTKVRRNLFNKEMISPSKRSAKRGLPRSHSVSAVEGLECKLDNFKRTKGVHHIDQSTQPQVWRTESPLSVCSPSDSRSQKRADHSPPASKAHERACPRWCSQTRALHRFVRREVVQLCCALNQRENSSNPSIRSPKRLFFGALSEMVSPSEKGSARSQRPSRNPLGSEIPTAYQTTFDTLPSSPSPAVPACLQFCLEHFSCLFPLMSILLPEAGVIFHTASLCLKLYDSLLSRVF
ncbi:hypothetical protein GH733_014902 [Mirounga leonina]|nr:hypothetical protein GH733_014902 [Mirounga leonina]